MTVLCLDQFGQLGGAQLCLLDALEEFQRRGWQAVIAAPALGPLLSHASALGAATESLELPHLTIGTKSLGDLKRYTLQVPRVVQQLAELARRLHPDVIYVNGPRLIPAVALAFAGRRCVFHAHSVVRQKSAAVFTGSSVATTGAEVIACCNFVAQPLRPFVSARRIHVVYNGVRDCGFQRKQSNRVGIVGRIAIQKGQLEFVEALRTLHVSGVIAGDAVFEDGTGYLDQVKQAATGLPIQFIGWSDHIAEIYARLDFVVVASDPFEATTRVIPEAWSSGVIVVALRGGGVSEIVRDGENGFLATSVETGLRRALATPPAQLDRMRLTARSDYESRFTVARFQQQIADLIGRKLPH